jgi:hypothetical protein
MDSEAREDAARRAQMQQLAAIVVVALGSLGMIALAYGPNDAADPRATIKPMLAMFALTTAVWICIPLIRHWAVYTRRARLQYYADFRTNPPEEWLERPARAFNNLMQAPTLFYVLSLLMIVTYWADSVQIALAWIFVALRVVHAVVYLVANHLPSRFASFALSSFALWEMWMRYGLNAVAW